MKSLIPFLCICLLFACSQQPDLDGYWYGFKEVDGRLENRIYKYEDDYFFDPSFSRDTIFFTKRKNLYTYMAHNLETGAKRLAQGISNDSFESGGFYASKIKVLTGPMVDQSQYFEDLKNKQYQDNAREAILRFL